MEEGSLPEDLLILRDRIDTIDAELLALLAKRFSVTREVGRLKAEKSLDSFDPVREQQKLERLQAMAIESGLDPDFVHELFQSIFREVVANHRQLLKSRENA